MSATARKLDDPITLPTSPPAYDDDALNPGDETGHPFDSATANEYATRGARAARAARPNLRMVSPLRPEKASRGVFAVVVVGMLIVGMLVILVINTSLAQGAFTVSELQAQQAALTQQEQALSQVVAAAAAPEMLENKARAMGMVPSQTPVFLKVPSGKVLGKAKAAPGGSAAEPVLRTPADATASEAVDTSAVGTDLPVAPGVDYDPAAMDAAATQAKAASTASARASKPAYLTPAGKQAASPGAALSTDGGAPVTSAKAVGSAETKLAGDARPAGGSAKPKKPKPSEGWSDSTIIDVTESLSSNDAGLVAKPVG